MSQTQTAVEELKEATREAHAMMKDMRLLSKELKGLMGEARDVQQELSMTVHDAVSGDINVEIGRYMDQALEAIQGWISRSQDTITDRFEQQTNLLVFGHTKQKGQSVFDMFEKRVDAMRDYVEALEKDVKRWERVLTHLMERVKANDPLGEFNLPAALAAGDSLEPIAKPRDPLDISVEAVATIPPTPQPEEPIKVPRDVRRRFEKDRKVKAPKEILPPTA